MKLNDTCPLFAFITSTISMIVCTVYAAIPAAIALGIFHEVCGVSLTMKNYIAYAVIATLIISGVPRKKKNVKEVRLMIYQ